MGAFGYGPLDNDSALDWLAPIDEHVDEAIYKAYNSATDRNFRRFAPAAFAAIGVMLQLSELRGRVTGNLAAAEDAVDVLDRMMQDNEEIDTWDRPAKRRDTLGEYREKLKALVSSERRRFRRHRRSR